MIAIVGFVFVATAQVTKKPFRLGPGVDRALYIGPVASALLSRIILGEPPNVIHIIGGTLILGGVWVSLEK
jgi:drug/metabolite transporter (DMT)-like permease